MKLALCLLALLPGMCLGQDVFFLDGKAHVTKHEQYTYKFLFRYKQTAHKPIEIDKIDTMSVIVFMTGIDTMYTSSDSTTSLLKVHHKTIYPADSFDKIIFTSRDKTKKEERLSFFNNQALQSVLYLQYDNKGNVIYTNELSPDGKKFTKEQFFFNSSGLDTLSITTNNDSVVIMKTSYFDTGDFTAIVYMITYPNQRRDTYYVANRLIECSDTTYINTPLIINNVQEDIKKELHKRRYDILRPKTMCSHHTQYFIYNNNITGKCHYDPRLGIWHFDLIADKEN